MKFFQNIYLLIISTLLFFSGIIHANTGLALNPDMSKAYKVNETTTSANAVDGYAVGAIPGHFSVGASGAANYSIPIDVLPGVKGMQPNVSLVYSSLAGNGIAGKGWNLSGISSIDRVSKTLYQDGEVSGIDWTDDDALTLDGNRLVIVDDSDYPNSVEYRTEVESYRKIIGYNYTSQGAGTFKVWTKDGKEICYNPVSLGLYDGNTMVSNWCVSEVKDKFSNFISYYYKAEQEMLDNNVIINKSIRLDSISYGHGTNEVAYVTLEYKDRFRDINNYQAGCYVIQEKRLDSIKVGAQDNLLRSYKLGYRFLEDCLDEVKLSGLNDEKLTSTTFVWDAPVNGSPHFTGYTNTSTLRLEEGGVKEYGDFNGDGRSDYVISSGREITLRLSNGEDIDEISFSTASTTNINHETKFLYSGDFNGDGMDDLLSISAVGVAKYYFSTGTGFEISCYGSGISGFSTSITEKEELAIGDYDGDGREDAFLWKENKLYDFKGDLQVITSAALTVPAQFSDYIKPQYVANVTDNRKDNICLIFNNIIKVYELNGNTFSVKYEKRELNLNSSSRLVPGDFNGDGKTDFFLNSGNTSKILYSTGRGFVEKSVSGLYNLSSYNIYAAYLNKDALCDLVLQGNDIVDGCYAVKLAVNNVSGFMVGQAVALNISESVSWDRFDNIEFFDFNGDGRSDITSYIYSGSITPPDPNSNLPVICGYRVETQTFDDKTPDRIVQIDNGMELLIDISYSPLWCDDVYTTSSNSFSYPYAGYGMRYDVVSQSLVTAESTHATTYSYGGMLVHKLGRGFLGFEKNSRTDVTDDITNISTATLNTDYQVLEPEKQQRFQGNTLLSESEPVYSYTDMGNTTVVHYKAELDEVISTNHLNNTATRTEYQYDDDGNTTYTQSTYYDNGSLIADTWQKTTASYTGQNQSSWCNYLPENIEITQKSPSEIITRSSVNHYNNDGTLDYSISDPGDAGQITTTYSNYNSYGLAETMTVSAPNDSRVADRTTTTTYTTDGRFVESQTFGAFTSSYLYDLITAQLQSETSATGLTTHYYYNGLGQMYKSRSPLGTESLTLPMWCIGDDDAPAAALYYRYSESSGTAPVKLYYNQSGQLVRSLSKSLDGQKVYQDQEYDAEGRLWRSSMPYFSTTTATQWTSYTYDELNRVITTTSPDMTVQTVTYEDAERRVNTKVEKNNETQQSTTYYNALGQVYGVSDELRNQTYYGYDAAGRLKQTYIDATYPTTLYYDLQGRQIATDDPDAGHSSSTYDAYGQLRTATNARSQQSTYSYDSYGRLTGESAMGDLIAYHYLSSGSAMGQLDNVTLNGSTNQSYSYDSYGRMTAATEYLDGTPYTHSQTYDAYGRINTQQYPGGYTIVNIYNERGYLWQVTQGGSVIYQNDVTNATGQITSYTLGSHTATRGYDELGRLTYQGCGNYQSMNYDYDAMGNMAYREDDITNQKECFGYDGMNRLKDIKLDQANNYIPSADKFLNYDNKGNITFKTNVGADISYGNNIPQGITAWPNALSGINIPLGYQPPEQDITYTYFNKVESISQDDGYYTYDYTYGLDKQRRKTVYKEDGNTIRTKRYLGNYEIVEDADGNIKEYHYLSADAGLYAIYVETNGGNGELKYVLTDHLGSLTEIIDATTG